MAIAAFKVAEFSTALDLQKFVATGAPVVVVSIVFNGASGKYVLFYT